MTAFTSKIELSLFYGMMVQQLCLSYIYEGEWP